VRSMLDELGLRVGVVESVATDNSGIREAFVFAVRLALDRVRDLMRTGTFPVIRPEIDNADELLADMKSHADGSLDFAESSGLVHTRLSDIQADSLLASSLREATREQKSPVFPVNPSQPPAPPNAAVASGLVWPPVDGRLALHEMSKARIALNRTDDGDWSGIVSGKWRLHSASYAVFSDVEEGRGELVLSARTEASLPAGTAAACVVLAADGQGQYRLWRIDRIA